jgi:hypothetical protein
MPSRSQSSIEFTILISFMFLIFIVFFYVIGTRFIEIRKENDRLLLDDLGDYLKSEISFASASMDGYQRTFTIPSTLAGKEYQIVINDYKMPGINHTEIVLNYIEYLPDETPVTGYETSFILPLLTRTESGIDPSTSTYVQVTRTDGEVSINTIPDPNPPEEP